MFIGSCGQRGGRAAMVLVAALMVAATVGLGAAYLVKRGKAGIPGGPRLGHADELQMVPGTAAGFVHVRWKDVRGKPGADELRQIIERASPHAKAVFDPSSEIDPKTIERITVVFVRATEPPAPQPVKAPKGPPPKGKEGPPKAPAALPEPVLLFPVNSYVILTLAKPYDIDKVQLALVRNQSKKKLGDKEYIEDTVENVAVYSPDDTTLVVGDAERIGQLLTAAAPTGALSAALERAAEGGRHVVAALDMGTIGLDPHAFAHLSPGFVPLKENFETVSKSQAVTLEVTFGEETKIEYRAKYRTDVFADEARAAFVRIADYAREHSGEPNAPAPPDAPKPKGKRESEVITKLIAPLTFGRLNESLGDVSFLCQNDEVVIVPKSRSAPAAYAALAATSSVLIKLADKPKPGIIR